MRSESRSDRDRNDIVNPQPARILASPGGAVTGRDAQGLTVALAGGESFSVAADAAKASSGDTVTIGIRPEHALLADGGLPVQVGLIEQLGGNTVLYGTLSAQQPVVVQVIGQSAIRRGDTVQVQFPPAACHAFDAKGLSLAG